MDGWGTYDSIWVAFAANLLLLLLSLLLLFAFCAPSAIDFDLTLVASLFAQRFVCRYTKQINLHPVSVEAEGWGGESGGEGDEQGERSSLSMDKQITNKLYRRSSSAGQIAAPPSPSHHCLLPRPRPLPARQAVKLRPAPDDDAVALSQCGRHSFSGDSGRSRSRYSGRMSIDEMGKLENISIVRNIILTTVSTTISTNISFIISTGISSTYLYLLLYLLLYPIQCLLLYLYIYTISSAFSSSISIQLKVNLYD